jgi:nanoRNase/pAp phosphatase (c-di-AMP/oligoRNAs hydrolase)
MENTNEQINLESPIGEQLDSSHGFEPTEVYKLSAQKLSRNQQKIERRKLKYKVSDRRSQMRLSADGEPQQDRRKANRIAYAEMYSRLKLAE